MCYGAVEAVCDLHSYLHDCVVSRDVDCEQIKVSGGEDQGEQHLRLPRDACRERKKGGLDQCVEGQSKAADPSRPLAHKY